MKKILTLLTGILLIFAFNSFVACQKVLSIHEIKLKPSSKETHLSSENLRHHDLSSNSYGSMVGFFIGPILFFSAFACIWFNQKRAVIDYRRLKLSEQICVDVNPLRRDQISAAHNKLTHVSGNAVTNQVLRDNLSNLIATNAIKLIRSVEVKEWRAQTNDRNGARQINYNLGWHETNCPVVEGRTNPASNWFIQKETIFNEKVFVGEYCLSKNQQQKCSKLNNINPDINHANSIAMNTRRISRPQIQNEYIYFPSPVTNDIQGHGALRIKYAYCPTGPITLMARTINNTFQPFPIASVQGKGKIQKVQLPVCCSLSNCVAELLKPIEEIYLVEEQIMNRQKLIAKNIKKSKVFTWIIRFISYWMIVFGICMFLSPITAILGFVPLVGGILKGTVAFIIIVGAIIVAIPLWIVVFSTAWLRYHPKMGAIILGIGLVVLGTILAVIFTHRNGQQNAGASTQTVKHLIRNWSS